MIQAGWIPPQYRKFVTEPLTTAEAEKLVGTCGVYDEQGKYRNHTREEIQQRCQRVLAVIDLRDGSLHPQCSRTIFTEVRDEH